MKKTRIQKFLLPFIFLFSLNLSSCDNGSGMNTMLENKLCHDYKELYSERYGQSGLKASDFEVKYYIGNYNGYEIAMIVLKQITNELPTTDSIDDIEINYPTTDRLRAWKNGEFYYLFQLYDSKELSKEDILSIKEEYYRQSNQ